MKYLIAATACAMTMTTPVSAEPKPPKPIELSATDLRTTQTRTYQAPMAKVFPAVIASMQSLNYLNIEASKDAGTIRGETEAKGKAFFNILWGLGKKKFTQQASFLVEEVTPGTTTVQLNLMVNESKSRGIFGTSFKDGKLVKFGEPYTEIYSTLDAEVLRRSAMVATPAAAPASAQ